MHRISLYIIAFFCTMTVTAQELNCRVTVNSDMIEGSNKQIYTTLQRSVEEAINTTRWTTLTFADNERIECNMMIVVKSNETGLMKCEMQLQSRRPVYGTSYTTPLINMKDNNFTFKYQEFDRIEFQPNTFTTNLAALIGYYCYLVIGYDMDSYSSMGGTPYFQVCEDIASSCQSASMEEVEATGWKAFESNRNRYALVSNLQDAAFKKFREYMYTYHRTGLDEMSANVANARARIAADINILRDTNRARPATFAVNAWLDAKSDELVSIFRQGTAKEKQAVLEVLNAVDPTRQSTYEKINDRH